MNWDWKSKALREASQLSSSGIKWKDYPKWLKFKFRLMTFIWDWLTWDAIKEGWPCLDINIKAGDSIKNTLI